MSSYFRSLFDALSQVSDSNVCSRLQRGSLRIGHLSLNHEEMTRPLLRQLAFCSAESELQNMLRSVCFRIHGNQCFSVFESMMQNDR